MRDSNSSEYVVLVQTNKYAGNFEREMCAYMTGSLGDCGVGDEEAEQFKEDMKEQGLDIYFFDGMITSKPDDHGCYRPVAMTDQDGNGYNSLEIYFDGKPTKEMLDLMRERAVAYGIQNSIAVRDVKLYNKITSTQYLEEIL